MANQSLIKSWLKRIIVKIIKVLLKRKATDRYLFDALDNQIYIFTLQTMGDTL